MRLGVMITAIIEQYLNLIWSLKLLLPDQPITDIFVIRPALYCYYLAYWPNMETELLIES